VRGHADDVERLVQLLAVPVVELPELVEPRRRSAGLAIGVERARKVGHVTQLEARVSRVIRQRAEHVGPAHAEHDRAVAAGRLAEHAPRAARDRRVLRVDERDDLVDQVVLVAAGARAVDVLVAADAREAIRRRDDHRRARPARDQSIEPAIQRLAQRIDVEQMAARPREAHDREQRRIASLRIVIGRHVDDQLAVDRIAERIAGEDTAGQPMAMNRHAVTLPLAKSRRCAPCRIVDVGCSSCQRSCTLTSNANRAYPLYRLHREGRSPSHHQGSWCNVTRTTKI
jgi:hypothetical protein